MCRPVTEIPEHLLKRSRERRQAMGLPSDGEPAADTPSTPSAASPAPVKAAAPTPAKAAPAAPAAPPPPKPDPPYVAAAKNRRKMPYWAMTALGLLPLWGFLYVRGLTPEEVVVEGPMGVGAEEYVAVCATCHGVAGGGGAGRPLANGEVLKTFPQIEDQLNMVYTGSQAYALANLPFYGDPNREGGGHVPGWGKGAYMPAQGGVLTDAQILGVVCEERYGIGGADPTSEDYLEEYETWCTEESEFWLGLEDGSLTFDTIEGVGTEPRPSAPAQG